MSRLKIQPGKVSEFGKAFDDEVLRTLRGVEGLRGFYLFTNEQSSEAYTIGIWDTEAHAVAFETSGAFKQGVAQIASFLAGPPERRVYEVAANL